MREPINEPVWQQLTQDVMTEMREWRLQHPKATPRATDTRTPQTRSVRRQREVADRV